MSLGPECVDDPDALLKASNNITSDCAAVIGMIGCNGVALDGSGKKVSDVCCGSCKEPGNNIFC